MTNPRHISEQPTTAITEGYEARIQGFAKRDCPYPRASESAARWLRGYDAAVARGH